MPVETTTEKARLAMESGDIHRAKEILRSSFGNYGFSPPLYLAYADVLLALNEKAEAGRYLFFAVENLEDKYADAVSAFLSRVSGGGYKSIVRAAPRRLIPKLSELPAFSRQRLKDLGAPENLSRLYRDLSWVGCLAVAVVIISLASIGLWTVIHWIVE